MLEESGHRVALYDVFYVPDTLALAASYDFITATEVVEHLVGWHYKNDPTHVSFFSRSTWRWWAGQAGAGLTFQGDDVMLLHKAPD